MPPNRSNTNNKQKNGGSVMSRRKYEEKLWILRVELEKGEISQGEYNEREMELYRYWLAYGVDED